MNLHIADNLSLPLDFVTQSQAILAKKRVGKTYTAQVQAEELLKAGQQIVAIDPTGAWWGLKSSADGKHAGFSIAVFGGEHADVPLEEHAGEVIATALVEQRFSAILDLSLFRKGQINRFMTPFLETLYRLNREAMHLFVDEADAIAPQKPFGEEARMLGAMEDVVRRGGIRGIGTTLISQRPAVVNKNVLTQCEILTALRIVHHKDIDAIREWIEVHADVDVAEEMIASLPTLPTGTAWMWAPGWGDIFQKIKIREKETFDSGATPKAGQVQRRPKVLADVDIKQLGEQIASTVQRAKENDPKELRKQIQQLRAELAQRPTETKTVTEEKIVEVPTLSPDDIAKLNESTSRMMETALALEDVQRFMGATAESIKQSLAAAQKRPVAAPTRPAVARTAHQVRLSPTPRSGHLADASEDIPKGERATLIAVAQHPEGVGRDQLSILTGYKRSSRDAYLVRLATKGFIVANGHGITVTQEGIDALGTDYEPLPTGDALRDYWLNRLPEGERAILEILVEHAGEPVEREILDERTGYKRSSRDAYLSRLAARRLVESSGRGMVAASSGLFD